ncbi:hypothetical protein BFV94_4882 [Alteromonas macleodii]|uniref:Uncharacterized protein n=1 Tax=Alteromonas macleodii TaxID=28108 RepID=A0AB36FL84_ALTMA|nr:hypothetical protein BFV94_4882 [Alteromonas macleodii]OES24720.1 hypothetical protein BFV93_4690 [Alteromonas macleodii]OES24952.1 hypothetical protein BFV95_4512 [Alteromonas macleodii]OES38471.1 hypothetical protein BFV96_4956 [Alteromonas macleodii]
MTLNTQKLPPQLLNCISGSNIATKLVDIPDYIERIMPDGRKSLGHLRNA